MATTVFQEGLDLNENNVLLISLNFKVITKTYSVSFGTDTGVGILSFIGRLGKSSARS